MGSSLWSVKFSFSINIPVVIPAIQNQNAGRWQYNLSILPFQP